MRHHMHNAIVYILLIIAVVVFVASTKIKNDYIKKLEIRVTDAEEAIAYVRKDADELKALIFQFDVRVSGIDVRVSDLEDKSKKD